MDQRVLVVEIVTRDQPVHRLALDAEEPVVDAVDLEAAARSRFEHSMLGQFRHVLGAHAAEGGGSVLRRRGRANRHAPQQLGRQLVEALARRRRRDEHRHVLAEPLLPRRLGRCRLLLGHEVRLGQSEDPRQPREPRVVQLELVLDRGEVRLGVRCVQRCEIEHVDKQPGALDMREELVAEAGALRRALDQARDVGQDQLAVRALQRAEDRLERRERIARDLRRRARHPRQQRRLAGVRQPDEPHVGEQLQLQLDPALAALEPVFRKPRRLPRGRREALVAAPAASAARHDRALARHDQVVHGPVFERGDRPRRDADDQVAAVGAVALRALAVTAAIGLVVRAALEGLQVAQRVVADEDDVAAVPAVAAVGAAARDMRLTAERHAAVAAAPCLNEDASFVREHRPRIVGVNPWPTIASS